MPAYYHAQDPAQYYSQRQGRKDSQFQNMLRMMMHLQNMKQDRSQWEQGQAMKQQQFALDKEQFKSIDQYRKQQAAYQKHLMKPTPPTPTSTMKTIEYMVAAGIAPDRKSAMNIFKGLKDPERIKVEAQARAEGTAAGQPPETPTVTQYEQKRRDLKTALDSGSITPEEFAQGSKARLGIPKKSDAVKDVKTNRAFVQKTFAAYDSMDAVVDAAREQVKGIPGAVPTRDGVRLDMPTKYNVAQLNREYKVEQPKDNAIIELYDEMFDTFLNYMLPDFKSFKNMMKNSDIAKDKEIDLKQVKLWFQIYK